MNDIYQILDGGDGTGSDKQVVSTALVVFDFLSWVMVIYSLCYYIIIYVYYII